MLTVTRNSTSALRTSRSVTLLVTPDQASKLDLGQSKGTLHLSLRKKIGSNFELTGIVQNLFDQKAEKTVGGFLDEGGTDVSYFNPIILGRTFTIAAKVKI